MPPLSIELINKKYHEFYNDLKNPDTFKSSLEGVNCFRCNQPCKCLDYMSVAYIPNIQKTKILKLKCNTVDENLIVIKK